MKYTNINTSQTDIALVTGIYNMSISPQRRISIIMGA